MSSDLVHQLQIACLIASEVLSEATRAHVWLLPFNFGISHEARRSFIPLSTYHEVREPSPFTFTIRPIIPRCSKCRR